MKPRRLTIHRCDTGYLLEVLHETADESAARVTQHARTGPKEALFFVLEVFGLEPREETLCETAPSANAR